MDPGEHQGPDEQPGIWHDALPELPADALSDHKMRVTAVVVIVILTITIV